MSNGHIFLAQNSDINYVRQAYALSLSIKKFNKQHNQTCIITNDEVPDEYRCAFDHVVKIPWTDLAIGSQWKIENRWKLIYASPFKKNIVYDTDMLLLDSNDYWWDYFDDKKLLFTGSVRNYKGKFIDNDYYRKTFTANNLCNVYTGAFYFEKSEIAYEFFKWLELIIKEWQVFYRDHLKKYSQKFCSLDVSAALALRFMNIEETSIIKNSRFPTFVHMKPAIQGWKNIPELWTDAVTSYFDNDCKLKVGNIQQHGLFHYVEDEFLENHIIEKLEKNV